MLSKHSLNLKLEADLLARTRHGKSLLETKLGELVYQRLEWNTSLMDRSHSDNK